MALALLLPKIECQLTKLLISVGCQRTSARDPGTVDKPETYDSNQDTFIHQNELGTYGVGLGTSELERERRWP